MRVHLNARNYDVSARLKSIIEKKLSKLNKFFDDDVDAYVTLLVERQEHIMEITIPFNGMMLRAERSCSDFYSAIDDVLEVLERQINKHRTKLERRMKPNAFTELKEEPADQEDAYKIVKVKRFAVKPMDAEEAILQMELVGHDFFVFTNSDTNQVNVIYKRKDGKYGLIEPEYED